MTLFFLSIELKPAPTTTPKPTTTPAPTTTTTPAPTTTTPEPTTTTSKCTALSLLYDHCYNVSLKTLSLLELSCALVLRGLRRITNLNAEC